MNKRVAIIALLIVVTTVAVGCATTPPPAPPTAQPPAAQPTAAKSPTAPSAPVADAPAAQAESKNMTLVGYNDLEFRSAYMPAVYRYPNNRYIAFVGHHTLDANPLTSQPLPSLNPLTGKNEESGTSIIDVTDPKNPKYLFHIPVPNGRGGGAQMLRVCNGSTLPAKDGKMYLLRTYASAAHEIWDVTDPSNPKDVRTVRNNNPVIGAQTGAPGALTGTHKSWWECDTGIAYIVGRRDTDVGWKPGNHIMIYDLSNPANPKFIRDWALDGQQPGGAIPANMTVVPSIHGPISTGPTGNRVYFAYGTSSDGVMQIVDRKKLLDPSIPATDFKTAEIGRWVMNPDNGAHTSFPLGKITVPERVVDTGNTKGADRDIVVVTSEETGAFCNQVRHLTYFVDVTDEGRPMSISTFQVPAASGGTGAKNFCDRGGRFGPHATNEEFGPPFYQKVLLVSYFNAGIRAIDVRDPYNPKEVAFYIPTLIDQTDLRCGPLNGAQNVCRQVVQTNNVATDDRGYIYIVDRADTGMHILQLTGDALKIIQ